MPSNVRFTEHLILDKNNVGNYSEKKKKREKMSHYKKQRRSNKYSRRSHYIDLKFQFKICITILVKSIIVDLVKNNKKIYDFRGLNYNDSLLQT